MIRYQPVGLEVNMRFIRFLIGAFLVVGSVVFAAVFLLLGFGFAAMSGTILNWVIWAAIDLTAFIGGLWLMAKNRP